MGNLPIIGADKPDNSAAIAEANKQRQEALDREKTAKDEQRTMQDQMIAENKSRRRNAFQRFSLLLSDGGEDTTLG